MPTAVSNFSSPSSAPRRQEGALPPARGTVGHRLSVHHDGSNWPPCVLRAELKSRTWPRFNACITPIRPNIVGPLSSTSISVSIAACHSGKSASLFGRLGDVARRRVISLRSSGSADRQTPGASRSNALPCLARRTSNRTRRNRATGCRFILRLWFRHKFTEMIDAPTNAHRYRVTDRSVLVISSGPYGHPAGATGVHARRTATLPEAVGRRQRGSAMFAAKPHEAEQELPKSIPEPRNVTRECRRPVRGRRTWHARTLLARETTRTGRWTRIVPFSRKS